MSQRVAEIAAVATTNSHIFKELDTMAKEGSIVQMMKATEQSIGKHAS